MKNMLQNSFVNFQGSRQDTRLLRERRGRTRRRNRAKSQRKKWRQARTWQSCVMPSSPFYQRWPVNGSKNFAMRSNISYPTIRRRRPIDGRGGFQVAHGRCRMYGQNLHQAFPFKHTLRLRHYCMNTQRQRLSKMDHIIFWDIDNWSRFFEKLRFFLPLNTFVWGFHSTQWNQPNRCLAFHRLISSGGFYKNYQSGRTKNAADFAMMLQVR